MSTTYGITPTGFNVKPLQTILAEVNAAQVASIDPALDTSANTPLGQINASHAAKLAEVWEALGALYSVADPDAAEDAQLDNVCAITGTKRIAAFPSQCDVQLTFSSTPPGSVYPAGSRAQVAGQPSNTWKTTADLAVPTAGVYTVTYTCETNGPTVANPNTLTVILSPVSGLASINNSAGQKITGALVEDDTDLRVRRIAELDAIGGSSVDAIRAKLLEVTGVQQAYVYENLTNTTDANGVPPHGIECVIFDGTSPQASTSTVAQTIWDEHSAGTPMYGNTSSTAVDSSGITQAVNFSRASVQSITISLTVFVNPATFPSNGVSLVQAALAAKSLATQNLAVPFRANTYIAAALTVAGVEDVTAYSQNFSGTTTIPMSVRQIAFLDASSVTVTVSNDPSPPPALP